MSAHESRHWHNARGRALAYRPPPTVDEAAMYSPFVSIIPFSSDMIPFPSAEPPTPPSTLTLDQQQAAKRAVGILNDEITGQTAAQHLHDTLRQLQRLLQHPRMPQYNFKPVPQLATPPPESPTKEQNGAASASSRPALSPFASTLLKYADVSFTRKSLRLPALLRQLTMTAQGAVLPEQPRHLATPVQQQPVPPSHARSPSLQQAETPSGAARAQNGHLSYPPSALSSAANSTPLRPGPAVVIKPISGRREDYQRFDVVQPQPTKAPQVDHGLAALKPHEREIADRNIEELRALVASLIEDKEDLEGSEHFKTVSTVDLDFTVMRPKAMDNLSNKMLSIMYLNRFSALPVDLITEVQSLLQPGVSSATKSDLFMQTEESTAWSESIDILRLALKASKMILDTMIEGRDDHRMRREEMIDMIIDLLKTIKEKCVVPILQARRSGSTEDVFVAATAFRKELQTVLQVCGSVMSRCAILISKYNLSDRTLHTLEYLTLELVMEQNSDSEKDSVFSIQKFEQFRQKAVDVLAEIFARHAAQQDSILNGVLSNLERLPDKKASARQFKSARDLPIMTISALFMRFVQVAATNRALQTKKLHPENAEGPSDEDASDYQPGASSQQKKKKKRNVTPIRTAQGLYQKAGTIASTIAHFLIERASNVAKTSDKPFRNLLDLFIEDFCNVLGSPEWPGADLLLEYTMRHANAIIRADKSSVNDKDMALSIMSRIGCGILDLKHRLKKLKQGKLDTSHSDLSSQLDRLFNEAMSDDIKEGVNELDLLAFGGPYRMVIESLPDYLDLHSSQDDPRLQSVRGCFVTLWLEAFSRAFPVDVDDADARPLAVEQLRERLELMMMDPKWLTQKHKFEPVSDVQSQLASGIITLQNRVCKHIHYIVAMMFEKIQDKHSPKLRSRGMNCLEQLIAKDRGVITQNNIRGMIPSLSDQSPMVRDSTLNVVTTCLEYQPSLQEHLLPYILRLASDTSNGPKKKAIKLLEKIYTGPSSRNDKIKIIASLLPPSQDVEKTISDLARNVLSDILFAVNKSKARVDESQLKLERSKNSLRIIDTVQYIQANSQSLELLEKFFKHALASGSDNISTCKELVADMVDKVISPESGSDPNSQARILTAMSIFAKVEPGLFTVDQLRLLQLYIKAITKAEDLALVRPTVIIFRYVIATLNTLQAKFADEVRVCLMNMVSKLANWAITLTSSRDTLIDVAHCVWTLTPMVDQGMKKLCTLVLSVTCQLRPLSQLSKEDAVSKQRIIKSYLILLGTFGKVCSFEKDIDIFRTTLGEQAKKNQAAQAISLSTDPKIAVALLLLDTVRCFTSQSWDTSIRVQALQSMAGICLGSPGLFRRSETEKLFKLVFINDDTSAMQVVLAAIKEYLYLTERRSESGAEIAVGQGVSTGKARLETSFGATQDDTAGNYIARVYHQNFIDTALKHSGELAYLAIQIIASISRQGMNRPKDPIAAYAALSTAPVEALVHIASKDLMRLVEKAETSVETEYMRCVHAAFNYQLDVCGDSHGMRESGYSAKLGKFFEAVKAGKKTVFRKFVNNICVEIDFNFATLDVSADPPRPVLFARFCLENLALLDFPTLEEVALCLRALESMVLRNTGPLVALAVEKEIPKRQMTTQQLHPIFADAQQPVVDATGAQVPTATPQPEQIVVTDDRLRQITTGCMILKMVWETRAFIRRCYNVQKAKGGIPQKDYIKPALRNNLVSGKELWESLLPMMNALGSRESMLQTCHEFADILDVDREAVIDGDEEEDDLDLDGYVTPAEDGTAPIPTSGGRRKRKSNAHLGNTPKRQRGRPVGAKGKKRNSKTPDGDGDSD
ncbi:Sister chromatid cohesion protein 2 [Pleosporales sp. CAS-2024a]